MCPAKAGERLNLKNNGSLIIRFISINLDLTPHSEKNIYFSNTLVTINFCPHSLI